MLNKPTGDMLNAAGSATPQGLGTAAAGTSTAYSREDHVHAIPTLSGDVTNTGAAVTVAKLQGNPVSASAPGSGEVLTWDGAQWAPAAGGGGGGGSGSGGGGLIYYFDFGNTTGISPTTGLPSSPVAVSLLGRTYSVGSGSVTSANLTEGSYSLVCGFVSAAADPGTLTIPAGLWDFNLWASVSGHAGSSDQIQFQVRVYKYDSTTGTYGPPIASSDPVYIYDPTVTAQYIANVTMPQTTLLATDRIYVELWAQKNVNQPRAVQFFFDSLHPSHVHSTLPFMQGTGLWKNVAGALQSPASLLLNADVDPSAGIAWSKIAPSYLGTRVKVVGRDAATIQGCIDLCTDADGEHPYTVLIPPITGSYSEPLTLKGSVSLVGLTTPLNADAVQITGTHTFTPASTQANTNRINFQNLTFISSGSSNNTITCSSLLKYFSKLTFSGCIFSGDKANNYSHLKTDDNVPVYVDNCRFESSAGGSASAGITQGNGPLYLSNNTTFDVSGRAIDVPVAAFPVTRMATVTGGTPGGTTTMTLTSGDITGLAVGMKISGANLGSTVTVVSLTAPSTVVMSTTPKTSGSFTATFGQTPYVEIHDSVLAGKGAEVVRLGNGLLTCNTSNFTNTATVASSGFAGSGINMLTGYVPPDQVFPDRSTTIGLVNSSFTIWDTAAYTITGAAAPVFAVLNGISYSSSTAKAFSTLIGANVTVYDYAARATSIANGGTGATTQQAALNALAGGVNNLRVLAGDGTNVTLRLLTAADIPNLGASKINSGQLAVAQGGTGAATLTGLVKGTGTTAMVAAVAGTDYQTPIGTISGIVKGNGANALTAAAAADVATTLGSQTAAYVYAAPAATAGSPGFRALVGGDLPATFTQSQTFAAGTTTVAPFKFQAGVKLTTAVAHAVEWDGTNLYATSTTPTRRRVAYIDDIWSTVPSTAPTGTIAFYAETHDVLYYQTAATGAWTLNITGTSAPVTLNTLMAIGQSRTVVLMVLQGATAYVPSIQIDGAAVTPKWGAEVSTGNASKTDMMSFTILKTAASTFTVFGSITKFA